MVEQYHAESEEEMSSASSEADMWIPDEPYGNRRRLINAIAAFKPGQVFFDEYTITGITFSGKPHLLLAQQRFGEKKSVVLKFYWEEAALENSIEIHSKVAVSERVCRIVQTLKTAKTGHPPCIAFEKGAVTLCNWMLDDHSLFDKEWCLHQVLTGLMEIHSEGIVHCDVKPSKVMFFPECLSWKLIGLDGAQQAGKQRAVCFTMAYAAPEVLGAWQEDGELPIAHPALDIWSFGILAFEVLTGVRMFGDSYTEDEICELVWDGKVEERLDSVVDGIHREALSNFLKFDPTERWSANDALQHEVFHYDSYTTTTLLKG